MYAGGVSREPEGPPKTDHFLVKLSHQILLRNIFLLGTDNREKLDKKEKHYRNRPGPCFKN